MAAYFAMLRRGRRGFMLRRRVLAAAAAAPMVMGASLGHAQAACPTKTVRFIVPFAPGGGTDTLSRLICDQLSRRFRQQFVVDNKGGAGGNIGTLELARAAPDGYTLGLVSAASHTLLVHKAEGDGFLPRPVHPELLIYKQADVERLAR
jgi:tripartite-type tricarboxylate transporter receptor subunit TctC